MFALVEACDYESSPAGGQLSFCKQLISVYGSEIYLVGVAKEGEPVGKWFVKKISGVDFHCFNIYRRVVKKKPIIPLRMKTLFALIFYKKRILGFLNGRSLFFQSPEGLISFCFFGGVSNACYYIFHGVDNPLASPRYKWGRWLAKLFDFALRVSLKKASLMLACCDKKSLFGLIDRLRLSDGFSTVHQFPTRYDDSVFFPRVNSNNSDGNVNKFIVVGRINKVKGWDFILNSISEFKKISDVDFLVDFVGDGEDRDSLESMVNNLGLGAHVRVLGFRSPSEISDLISGCDLMLVGSEKEGWSIAMLEGLACAKPVVTTDVSGARDLIKNGLNGYVADNRDPKEFAKLILQCLLNVPRFNQASIDVSKKYKMSGLKSDLDFYIKNENIAGS